MVQESQCPYCGRIYKSSTWYRNHMETAHSGFVQPPSTPKCPIWDEEPPLQAPQPAADSSLTTDPYSKNSIQLTWIMPKASWDWCKRYWLKHGKSQLFGHWGKHTIGWTTYINDTPHCWEIGRGHCTVWGVWRRDVVTIQQPDWLWACSVVLGVTGIVTIIPGYTLCVCKQRFLSRKARGIVN